MADPLFDLVESAITHVPVATFISRRSTARIVAANQAAADLFGYDSPTALHGVAIVDLTAPEHRHDVAANYTRVWRGGASRVKRYVRADGTSVLVRIYARPLVGHDDLAITALIELDAVPNPSLPHTLAVAPGGLLPG